MVVSKSKLHTFHQIVTLKRRQTFCFDSFPASIPNGPISALVFAYVLIFAENVTGFSFKVWLKRINALFYNPLECVEYVMLITLHWFIGWCAFLVILQVCVCLTMCWSSESLLFLWLTPDLHFKLVEAEKEVVFGTLPTRPVRRCVWLLWRLHTPKGAVVNEAKRGYFGAMRPLLVAFFFFCGKDPSETIFGLLARAFFNCH